MIILRYIASHIVWLILFSDYPRIVSSLPPFPLSQVVKDARRVALSSTLPTPTGLNKHSYLSTIDGVVEYFRGFLNRDSSSTEYGKIIDQYAKKEIQYSTPCFANAAALLLKEKFYTNQTHAAEVLADVQLTMTTALQAIRFGQPIGHQGCADGHCNFYIMPLMFALETLDGVVSAQTLQTWHTITKDIVPKKAYKNTGNNWGIVALTGEFLRYKAGLSNASIWQWSLDLLASQDMRHWTDNGEYMDYTGCNGKCNPMPYDHFPRKYMAVMLDRGYNGPNASVYWELNRRAAWTSMLLQSPWGELPTGARSSQHQWNEAVSCVTFELWASKLKQEGDMDGAKMMKRAARLSLQSLLRWKRPSGEWWIVKNRMNPANRWGFEGYSYNSQYNLLPASMLATAYLWADDSITEGNTFADTGGFVFRPDNMHKVIANVDGMYVEIELFPDAPSHDVLGLTRVHNRAADPLITVTAGAPSHPEGSGSNKYSLGIGVAWHASYSGKMPYLPPDVLVSSESPPYDQRFPAAHLLVPHLDDKQSSIWLLPGGIIGEGFVLDLKKSRPISGFLIQNTKNGNFGDRGTKDYHVQASNTSNPNDTKKWITVLRGKSLPWTFMPTTHVRTNNTIWARYIYFVVDSFYGKGAGLNSFIVLSATNSTQPEPRYERFSNFGYSAVINTTLEMVHVTPNQATFTVVYSLASSSVSTVKEIYSVTAKKVYVNASLTPSSGYTLRSISAVFPAFTTDGKRDSTLTIDKKENQAMVELPGDQLSMLNTSCMIFAAKGKLPLIWSIADENTVSRNGKMSAFVASYQYNCTTPNCATISYSLSPKMSTCK